MRDELACEIEAGRGTDEAVALALGWKELNLTPLVKPWERPWVRTKGGAAGSHCPGPPAFLTDLNALAAECERRGWRYNVVSYL